MSFTRGSPGRQKQFDWKFDPLHDDVFIVNEAGRELMYSIEEIEKILKRVQERFSTGWFPLSSDITVHGMYIARDGFGKAILEALPGDFIRLMGMSYLGVIFEECGYLEWNGKSRGIEWRLVEPDLSAETLRQRLSSLDARGGWKKAAEACNQ